MRTPTAYKSLLLFVGIALATHRASATDIHGTLATAPDSIGSLTILPQGKKKPGDAVTIATDGNTDVVIAGEKLGVANLCMGMWLQPEIENGIAKNIIAGNIVADDGDRCILFKGLPKEFFLDPAGFDVGKFPAQFGPLQLMYRTTGNGAFLRFGRKDGPKGGFVTYFPPGIRGKFYDGHTTQDPDADGKMTWPGDVSEIRIWFVDGTLPGATNAKPSPRL